MRSFDQEAARHFVICGDHVFDDQLRRRKGLPPRFVETANVRTSRFNACVAVQDDVIGLEPEVL